MRRRWLSQTFVMKFLFGLIIVRLLNKYGIFCILFLQQTAVAAAAAEFQIKVNTHTHTLTRTPTRK